MKDDEELFQIKFLSQKYLVLIRLKISHSTKNDNFRIINKIVKKKMNDKEFVIENNNEIDLTIFTNINNGIINKNYCKNIIKKLDELNQDINYDIKYITLEELEKNYEKF